MRRKFCASWSTLQALQWWIQLCPRLAGAYCVLFLCMYCVPSLLHFSFQCGGTIQKARRGYKLFGQMKITTGYVQILASVPSVYAKVPWPHTFVEFTSPLRLFNLEVFSFFFSLSSCTLSLSYDEMFVLHMVLPPALIVALLCAYFAFRTIVQRRLCRAGKKQLQAEHLYMHGKCSTKF